MNKNFWALAALNMIACGPTAGTDSVDTTCTECMVDSDGNEYPLGTGAVFIHATYELEEEVCQVLDQDGNVLGNTEEAIFGLEPGQFNFALGDPNKTTLDGVPFHVTGSGDYTTGSGDVEIVADEITQAEVLLTLAPQYHCASYLCDWPYEGSSSCDIDELDSEDQWIYVNSDGVLQGSEKDSFGGVAAIESTLIEGVFTVTPTDPARTVVAQWYDRESESFGYSIEIDAAKSAATVNCNMTL